MTDDQPMPSCFVFPTARELGLFVDDVRSGRASDLAAYLSEAVPYAVPTVDADGAPILSHVVRPSRLRADVKPEPIQ